MLCRIKNTETGYEKILSLPKNDKELNKELSDLGLNEENNYKHEITQIGASHILLEEIMLPYEFDIDELNLFARYYESRTLSWQDDFVKLINALEPRNTMEFLNLMYESLAYTVIEAKNIKELGKTIRFRFDVEGIEDEDIGRFYDATYHGKFVNGYYVSKGKVPEFDKGYYYNGVALEDMAYSTGEDCDTMCIISMREETAYTAYLNKKGPKPPSITIVLPATDYEIRRAMHRLGAESVLFEVNSVNDVFPINVAYKYNLAGMNELAEICRELTNNEYDIEKLVAVLESVGEEESIESYLEYIPHLPQYRIYPTVTSEKEVLNLKRTSYGEEMDDDAFEETILDILEEHDAYFSEDFGLVLHSFGREMLEDFVEIQHTEKQYSE